MTDEERKPVLVRLPAKLLRKVDRLARRNRKQMSSTWSRNDQICWMLDVYVSPEEEDPE